MVFDFKILRSHGFQTCRHSFISIFNRVTNGVTNFQAMLDCRMWNSIILDRKDLLKNTILDSPCPMLPLEQLVMLNLPWSPNVPSTMVLIQPLVLSVLGALTLQTMLYLDRWVTVCFY